MLSDSGAGQSNNGASSRGKNSSKQVIFSDGIRPGGDLSESGGASGPLPPKSRTGRVAKLLPGTGEITRFNTSELV